MTISFTYSIEQLPQLTTAIASLLQKNDVITLQGDLGAGKTTFTRALIQTLTNDTTEVLSPTFTLVQPYKTPNFMLWHYDLYRLKSKEEIIEIGLQESLDHGVSVIEWPEIIEHLLPKRRLDIQLTHQGETLRQITLNGTQKWEMLSTLILK